MKYRLKAADGEPARPRHRRYLGAGRQGSGRRRAEARARALGQGVRRGDGRLRLPARRPHPRRRRHGARRHPLQLLRHGPHRGRPRPRSSTTSRKPRSPCSRAAASATTSPPCAPRARGEEHRRRRLGAGELHGRVGRHVPHHHVGGRPPRRDDGDAQVRPPGHRGLHRRQGRPGAPAELQPVGAGDGRLHPRRAQRRALAARLRRQGLPHGRRRAPCGTA